MPGGDRLQGNSTGRCPLSAAEIGVIYISGLRQSTADKGQRKKEMNRQSAPRSFKAKLSNPYFASRESHGAHKGILLQVWKGSYQPGHHLKASLYSTHSSKTHMPCVIQGKAVSGAEGDLRSP